MKKLLLLLSFAMIWAFQVEAQIKVDTSGDVGIGSSSPAATLDVLRADDPSVRISESTDLSSYFEMAHLNQTTMKLRRITSTGVASIDIDPIPSDGTSNANFRFFRNTNTTGNAAFRILRGNNTSAVNSLLSGNGDSYFNNLTGNVGIGTSSPTDQLSVDGDASKPGGGTWATFSDRRLKKDVEEFTDGLKQILAMNPVKFKYNGKAGIRNTEKEYVGVIAQEMEKIAPYTVRDVKFQETFVEEDANGGMIDRKGPEEVYKAYDGTALTYMLVNAIQEQHAIIETQESDIDELKNELAELKALVLELNENTHKTVVELGSSKDPYLNQNQPNPFRGETVINYFVPANAKNARMVIYNLNGQILRDVKISDRGEGQMVIKANELQSGTYSYTLFVDDQVVGSKKMVLSW